MLRVMRTILIVMLNLIFYGLVLFGCVQVVYYGHDFAYDVLGSSSVELPPGTDKTVEISEGQTEYQVAEELERAGLVKNRFSFFLRTKLTGSNRKTRKSGAITLNTSMTYAEILDSVYGG